MNSPRRLPLLCFAIAILIAGCSGSKSQTAYYSLYAPTPGATKLMTEYSAPSLSVGPVIIPDVLKQSRIATGGEGGEYQLAEFHRWAGELDRDLAQTLAEHLSRELGTEKVSVFPWSQYYTPDFKIRLDVIAMGGKPGEAATLSVRWTVTQSSGKEEPIFHRTDMREPVASDKYSDWVLAQQRNVGNLASAIAQEIKTFK